MKEEGIKNFWKFLIRNNFVQKAKTDFQYKIKRSTSVKFVTINFDLVHRSCPSLSVMTAAFDWHEAYNFRAILSNIPVNLSHGSEYLKDIVRGIFLKKFCLTIFADMPHSTIKVNNARQIFSRLFKPHFV